MDLGVIIVSTLLIGVKRSKQVEALKKALKKTLGLETEERRFPSPWIVN